MSSGRRSLWRRLADPARSCTISPPAGRRAARGGPDRAPGRHPPGRPDARRRTRVCVAAAAAVAGRNAQRAGQPRPGRRLRRSAAGCRAAGRVPRRLRHRPLLRPHAGELARKGRYVAAAACERLLRGPLRKTLRLVVSGHTHQYLDTTVDGVRHLSGPRACTPSATHEASRPRQASRHGSGFAGPSADGQPASMPAGARWRGTVRRDCSSSALAPGG